MTVSKIASKIYQAEKKAARGVWVWRMEWSKATKQAYGEIMKTVKDSSNDQLAELTLTARSSLTPGSAIVKFTENGYHIVKDDMVMKIGYLHRTDSDMRPVSAKLRAVMVAYKELPSSRNLPCIGATAWDGRVGELSVCPKCQTVCYGDCSS